MEAVEAARWYAQSLAEINRTIRWDVLEFMRRIYGHPKQIGALTITFCRDHCQSFPLCDCVGMCAIGGKAVEYCL